MKIRLTAAFEKWSKGLKDPLVLRAIPARIDQMAQGNFGDHRSVGDKGAQKRDIKTAQVMAQQLKEE